MRQPGRMGLDQTALVVWEVLFCAVSPAAVVCKAAYKFLPFTGAASLLVPQS